MAEETASPAVVDENISEKPLNEELEDSFLTYAVAVVTSRAIPDVRDGFKPVHRRCLYGSDKGGYNSSKPTVKSARIVGDVMGSYHPHGDSAVYEAMANLVRSWVQNSTLFYGQGNWGSIGGEDPAAAARYCVTGDTLVRMADGASVQIRDLAEQRGLTAPGEVKVDLSVAGRLGEEVHASKIFHSGVHPTYTMTTESGYQLQGTGNHPVLAWSYNPAEGSRVLLWKTLAKVTPGDRVCMLADGLGAPHLEAPEEGLLADRVEVVQPSGEAAVYSLKIMTDEHAFITNGFVSHNTEARLTTAAEAVLQDIDEDTVDMVDNYDSTKQEPVVLPAAIPNLIVNGGSGIAVGVASVFAPHNLGEAVDALRHLLNNPEATVDAIMEFMPGPDFPTAGVIVNDGGIRDAYMSGSGRIKLRARTSIEDVTARKRGIVVTELPYGVGPEKVMAKISDLKQAGNLDGVSSYTNFTDRKSGLRLVVEVKNGFDPEKVLAQLYANTPLEVGFSFNQTALVGLEPRRMGMLEVMQHYLDHRTQVITRRSKFRLRKAEDRAHIVEGLVKAHANIDEIVQLIKKSETTKTASEKLQKSFELSERQAEAILEMTLRRLTGLELKTLEDELKALRDKIADLKDLIGSDDRLRQTVGDELQKMSDKFGWERRTEIISPADDKLPSLSGEVDPEVEDEPVTVAVDVDGQLFKMKDDTKVERPLVQVFDTTTTSDVGVVTEQGALHSFNMTTVNGTALPLTDLVQLADGDKPAGIAPRRNVEGRVVLVTEAGFVKQIEPAQFAKKDGLDIIKFKKDNDRIVSVSWSAAEDDTVVLVTSGARMLQVLLDGVRAQGRAGGGVAGVKLQEGQRVLAGAVAVEGAKLVTLTDGSSVKATPTTEYPVKGRGGAGVRCMNLKKAESELVSAAVLPGVPQVASPRAVKPVKLVEKRDASGNKPGITGDLKIGFLPGEE